METLNTYVINLKSRTDRKKHIIKEFNGRPEFRLSIIEPEFHHIGAVSLWLTIKGILSNLTTRQFDFVLICEDDHQFTDAYSQAELFKFIKEAKAMNADMLLGGVSWFNNALAVSDNLHWVERFSGFQFTIIYKRFYDVIINLDFGLDDAIDYKLSYQTASKFYIYPFISTQNDFGYSDVTRKNNKENRVANLFEQSLNKAKIVKYISNYYIKNIKDTTLSTDKSFKNFKIPTYIINLPERKDRLKHIKAQFDGKEEFSINIVEACKHNNGALGLWLSSEKFYNWR